MDICRYNGIIFLYYFYEHYLLCRIDRYKFNLGNGPLMDIICPDVYVFFLKTN